MCCTPNDIPMPRRNALSAESVSTRLVCRYGGIYLNWYWLVDGLQEAGYSVHLANTTAIKQYDGLKHRGDESDARHLAHVLRLGLLPEGHITTKAMRGVRDLARKRMQLVQQRTTQILSIETCVDQQAGAHISSNNIKKLTAADIDNIGFGRLEALCIKANLAVMHALQTQIDNIKKDLAKYCRSNPAFPLLKSVTEIGDVLATVILLETGSIERFADVENYASYCRCVGSVYESNGKKRRRQYQKRQSLFGVGLCRSRQFCDPLLRGRQKILSAQKSQA